mgnify:CR=1 FL=1
MSAGRRRMWWTQQNHGDQTGLDPKKEEDEDGRFESEGSERRVPSEGHAEGSDRTEI